MTQQRRDRLTRQRRPQVTLGVITALAIFHFLSYGDKVFAVYTAPFRACTRLFTGLSHFTDSASKPQPVTNARDAIALEGLNAFMTELQKPTFEPQRLATSSMLLFPALGLLANLVWGGRHRGLNWHSRYSRVVNRAEASVPAPAVKKRKVILKAANKFCNLFALWIALAATAALKAPSTFSWIPVTSFTKLLALLMFSVGITTTVDDFKRCLQRPGAMAINFISCYGIMPTLALILAKLIKADDAILAGMVLIGSVNGGQSSNLCTLIAGGDVALSVLMTTSTTIGSIFVTPLLCKLVLGTVVPIDAVGIVISTFQVFLAPIFLGVFLREIAPAPCKAIAPFTPVVGVIATVMLVGASMASCAGPIISAGLPLQAAVLGLHLFGGILGFWAARIAGYNAKTCRTVAIETAMKSSAFGFLLATLHFGSFDSRVPAAVSVVWVAIVGSTLAVYWKGCSEHDEYCEFQA